MHVIGVTGGVGMGKSTTAELLARRGLPVCDTDVLARDLVNPGEPALEEIRREFGEGVLKPDGHLDRAGLAQVVFSDPNKRRRLEAILHPRILEGWRNQLSHWRSEGKPMAVVVIPLLYETQAETAMDSVVCVACSAETQRRRLVERGWNTEEIERRNAAQWSVEEKMRRADFVVWTEPSLEVHEAQLDRLLADMRSRLLKTPPEGGESG